MAKSKMNTLQAALNNVTPKEKGQEKPPVAPRQKRTTSAKVQKPPSRENTSFIGGHFPRDVAKQFKLLAVEEDASHQELLDEALQLLFLKKNSKNISL